MREIIKKIRNKPHENRSKMIWIIAGITAAIMLIVWLVVGNGRRSDNDSNFFQSFNQELEESKTNFDNPLK